ncbi:2783_t:CDS:2 [Acaulospora morrowiae]|uniref:SWR1-complex protein 5 n=1 Tax=Acaulospora morrowiae TaxID=94023 RepID=A0A9N8WJH8_9GLOM|nr:2783_t:CDS:2 [Acaulospora morrowiae]
MKILDLEELEGNSSDDSDFMPKEESGSVAPERKINVDALWEELNDDKPNALDEHKIKDFQNSTSEDQMITITKTFEFAGEIVTEQRRVHIDSEEAKAYIESQTKTNNTTGNNSISEVSVSPVEETESAKPSASSTKKTRSPIAVAMAERGKFGRPKSNLSQLAASLNKKPVKINTLEKSKMDWKKYVEKEGIVHELKYHNKNGFVEKQEFLQRTYEARDSEIKALRKGVKK